MLSPSFPVSARIPSPRPLTPNGVAGYTAGTGVAQAAPRVGRNMDMSLTAAGFPRLGALRLGRYLPVSVAVTVAVTVLPLIAVAQLGRARSPLPLALHVRAALVMSILIARG